MNSSDNTSDKVYLRYATERTDNLSIKRVIEDQLLECPQAILWDNDGLVRVIPIERVKNEVILRNEKRGAGLEPTPLVFYWRDTIEVNACPSTSPLSSTSTTRVPQ
jgi:hypothetical protein